MSKYVRKRTSEALQRALGAQPDAKGGKWTASDEAAAIGGVIDFLQDYMKRDGKIAVDSDGKEKIKGEVARFALTALEFANKCGGLTLSLQNKVAADDDDEEEDAAAPVAAPAPAGTTNPTKTQLRAHDHALNTTLLKGEKLWGRIKYIYIFCACL